jgi:FxsC-like protein
MILEQEAVMAYEFFMSYSRANKDMFLLKLFEDLSQAIRDRRGLGQKEVVGFFDDQDLELGEQWDDSIVEALQTSSLLLAVASPAYFKSLYCGKEWELFRRRITQGAPKTTPPLIKPIVWLPFDIAALPAPVSSGQLTFGDGAAIQNAHGFKYILKNLHDNLSAYNDLIDKLAAEIVAASDAHRALQRLVPVPALRDVPSAFVVASGAGAPPAPSVPATGPKHVRFVYVAAHPNDLGAARSLDAYLDVGGPDWKPFYPDEPRSIHLIAQNFVSSEPLNFTSEVLSFDQNLLAAIDDAWNKRQIVVLIVDGWSVHSVQKYQDLLRQLDGRLDYHWCVLVPRNDKDQDAAKIRTEIETAINRTFDRHAVFAPNPLFFRNNITSATDFKNQLLEVLTRLKEEIKKRAPVQMPMPVGPSRTVVSGP